MKPIYSNNPNNPNNSLVAQVEQRYGSAQNLLSRFSPQFALQRHNLLSKSVNVPTTALLERVYGIETLNALIGINLNSAFVLCGLEKMDRTTAETVIAGMLAIPEARTLNIAYFLDFCFMLATGKYEVYSGAPIQILKAFRQYIQTATMEQEKMLRIAREEAERKARAEEDVRIAKSWEDEERRTGKTRQQLIAECFANTNKLANKLSFK